MTYYPDLMFDLETYDTAPTAAIVQIAAVPFCLTTGKISPKEMHFDRKIKLMSSIEKGGTVGNGTPDWWANQDPEVQERVFSGTETIDYVLLKFAQHIGNLKVKTTWSHATFDPPILQSAYQRSAIRSPFAYWAHKDLRTLQWMAETLMGDEVAVMPFEGKPHDAYDDCIHQIEQACYLWKLITK